MKTTLKKFVSARITTFPFKFKQTSLIVPISLLTFIISLPSGKVHPVCKVLLQVSNIDTLLLMNLILSLFSTLDRYVPTAVNKTEIIKTLYRQECFLFSSA